MLFSGESDIVVICKSDNQALQTETIKKTFKMI